LSRLIPPTVAWRWNVASNAPVPFIFADGAFALAAIHTMHGTGVASTPAMFEGIEVHPLRSEYRIIEQTREANGGDSCGKHVFLLHDSTSNSAISSFTRSV